MLGSESMAEVEYRNECTLRSHLTHIIELETLYSKSNRLN